MKIVSEYTTIFTPSDIWSPAPEHATARLSTSAFIYTFKAGSFTLLHNFSASLTADADADHQDIIFKEYCVNIEEDQRLNITSNPDPHLLSPPIVVPPGLPKKPKNRITTIAAGVGGGVSGFVVLWILGLLIYRWQKGVKDSGSSDGTSWWGAFSLSTTELTTIHKSSLPSALCRYFTLADIKPATNNFDNILIIGGGGFGTVYKGYIDGGANPVAVKRLKSGSQQGAHEFETEISMLSQLRHLNLVSLVGYCNDGGEMILVYNYVVRGILREHLYDTHNPPLTWKHRLEICIGAARGLDYLHTSAKKSIIHRDVKTTNILLDEKWVAKVSDFGLSKVGPSGISQSHVSTVVIALGIWTQSTIDANI